MNAEPVPTKGSMSCPGPVMCGSRMERMRSLPLAHLVVVLGTWNFSFQVQPIVLFRPTIRCCRVRCSPLLRPHSGEYAL